MTRRFTTRIRFEKCAYIPKAGETLLMERDLSHRWTAVTIHRVKATFEHSTEPGVMLMDAIVSMYDLPRDIDFPALRPHITASELALEMAKEAQP